MVASTVVNACTDQYIGILALSFVTLGLLAMWASAYLEYKRMKRFIRMTKQTQKYVDFKQQYLDDD